MSSCCGVGLVGFVATGLISGNTKTMNRHVCSSEVPEPARMHACTHAHDVPNQDHERHAKRLEVVVRRQSCLPFDLAEHGYTEHGIPFLKKLSPSRSGTGLQRFDIPPTPLQKPTSQQPSDSPSRQTAHSDAQRPCCTVGRAAE